MSYGKIILRTQGGFGNRLRAIVSAVLWAEDIDALLEIFWPVEPGHMPCSIDLVIDTKSIPRLTYFRNGYINNAKQVNNINDMKNAIKPNEIRIESYSEFHPDLVSRTERGLAALRNIKIIKPLINSANEYSQVNNSIGIHIRRTDHLNCIAASPLPAFEELVSKLLAENPDCKIFIATDEFSVKRGFMERWGDSIISPVRLMGRRSVEQQQAGIIDWLLLHKCKKIYASAGSSFSELAALRAGIDLIYVY